MSGTEPRATGKLKVIILPLTFHQALRHEDKPAKCSGARKCGLRLRGQQRGVSSLSGDSSGTGRVPGSSLWTGYFPTHPSPLPPRRKPSPIPKSHPEALLLLTWHPGFPVYFSLCIQLPIFLFPFHWAPGGRTTVLLPVEPTPTPRAWPAGATQNIGMK